MKSLQRTSRFLLFLAFIALVSSCKKDDKSNDKTATVSAQITVPVFNRDTAFQFVQTQVEFGPRALGTEGHEACKNWIVQKLQSYGTQVETQEFSADVYTGESFPATNIISKINPEHPKRILLAAHWDTRHIADRDADPKKQDDPILGADDGASGVSVLLEIARVIQANPIDMGIDFVFFDAEDHGENGGADETWCLGAQYWSRKELKNNGIQYGILLDMVGAKGASFRKEAISLHFARHVVDKVWDLAQSMGYRDYFIDQELPGITDDHRFVNEIAGIPMIDIIYRTNQAQFGSHWHTHNDDLSAIDKNTLRVVGQVVLATMYRESANLL